MAIQRVLYDLRSADGTVPKWRVQAPATVGGRTVHLTYSVMPGDPHLSTALDSAPVVKREEVTGGTHYFIQASRPDFERIIGDINRKRARRDETPLDPHELLQRGIEIAETPELLISINADPEQFERAT
jgi:hypothetical protein